VHGESNGPKKSQILFSNKREWVVKGGMFRASAIVHTKKNKIFKEPIIFLCQDRRERIAANMLRLEIGSSELDLTNPIL
jgi:hypothetical protein